MKLINCKLAIMAIFFASFTSCSKSSQSDIKVEELSTVSGQMQLYNDGRQLTENTGMLARIENMNPQVETSVKSDGSFKFSDLVLKPGEYTIIFSKPGYGIFKKYFNVNDPDNKSHNIVLSNEDLGSLSQVSVNSLNVNISGDVISFQMNLDCPVSGFSKYVRFFHRNNVAGVSWDSQERKISGVYPVLAGNNVIALSKSDFYSCGYRSGDKVYLKVYGDSYFAGIYTDRTLSKTIFPCLNLNTVPEISFILP